MKNVILISFFLLCLCFTNKASAQIYWDWVIDTKSIAAFVEKHTEQQIKLNEWLQIVKKYEKTTSEMEAKTEFIKMVRETYFNSLQDVSGIDEGEEKRAISNEFSLIHECKNDIDKFVAIYPEYKTEQKFAQKYFVEHCDELLTISKMAMVGDDEKNLLDKRQRLMMLNYILTTLRDLRVKEQNLLMSMQTAKNVKFMNQK